MVVVRLKKAWRGLGDWAESPSSDVLDRTAYARYGSAASANMFCRALSNNSYEGWSRDSRMISLLACRITRPGRAISAKRTALSRLLTHCPPNTRRFIAELKLNASTAMAHHAALAPNSLDGSLPPARSLLRTLWTSLPLPHLCLDHQITSSPARVRFVTTPKTLNQPLLDNSIAGKGFPGFAIASMTEQMCCHHTTYW